MDGKSLQVSGVGSWFEFSRAAERDLLRVLPESPGIYVVLFPLPQPRALGLSDIAYIGKATNQKGLRGRVRQYYHPGPTQSTNIAMNGRICQPGCQLRLGFAICSTGPVARRLESDLLIDFERLHGERPPFNLRAALDLLSRIADSRGAR